jgi:hypothetical protein
MDKSGVTAALPIRLRQYPIQGTCIQGGANYAALIRNVKEFVPICDTNVAPLRRVACSRA